MKRSLLSVAGGALGAAALAAVIGLGPTGAAADEVDPSPQTPSVETVRERVAGRFAQLTDDQRACLEQAGLSKPEDRTGPPTVEERERLRGAAADCGIEVPQHAGRGGGFRGGFRGGRGA